VLRVPAVIFATATVSRCSKTLIPVPAYIARFPRTLAKTVSGDDILVGNLKYGRYINVGNRLQVV